MSMATFFTELEERDAQLEAARATRDTDPEAWAETSREYAEWRRAIRLLGGRPIGSHPWPGDVAQYIADNPTDPRVQTAVADRISELEAEVAALKEGAAQ